MERLDIAYETLVDERPEGGELAEVKERRPWVPLGPPMRSPRVSAAAAWLYAPTKVRFASQQLDIFTLMWSADIKWLGDSTSRTTTGWW